MRRLQFFLVNLDLTVLFTLFILCLNIFLRW